MIKSILDKWSIRNISDDEKKIYLYLNDWYFEKPSRPIAYKCAWTNKMKLVFDGGHRFTHRNWFTLDEAYIIESKKLYTSKSIKIDNSDLNQQLKQALKTLISSTANINSGNFNGALDDASTLIDSLSEIFDKK